MKKFVLPILALSIMALGCKPNQKTLSAGMDVNNMDTTAVAGAEFYQYACVGWMAAHPLTAESSRHGAFATLAVDNLLPLHYLIAQLSNHPHVPGTVDQAHGHLY